MRKPTHPIPSNRRTERGVAIVFVTFAIAALLVAISGALVTGAANSRATSNYKGASQIHFVAESGISHAVQNINKTGTTHFKDQIVDDWPNRFGTDAKSMAPMSGFTYTVTVQQNDANPSQQGSITSTATGPDGYKNTVVATVVRTNNLATAPGAVYLATDSPVNTNFNGNNFDIDGNDHDYMGGSGPGDPVPGLSTRNQTNTASVVGTLGSSQLDNIVGLGYQATTPPVPSVMTSSWAPSTTQMQEYIDRLDELGCIGSGPTGTVTGGGPTNSYKICGSKIDPALPMCCHSHGTVSIGAGNVEGSGVWIVDGDLELAGTLDFAGLIIVKGNTTTKKDPGTGLSGNATVYGSLWSWDVKFSAAGSAMVLYSTNALTLANQVVGGAALPTTVRVSSLANCAAVPAGSSGCPNS
jgi:hypothetical protein